MNRASAALLLLSLCWLAAPAAAEPDRTEALAKAKAKFEQEVAKAEDALLAGIDKALTKAQNSGNKSLAERLSYERDLFVNQRIVPTAVPTTAYLRQRAQATAALLQVYNPAVRELNKAKKEDEAAALESALGDLLKASRGYGLAIPDLMFRPPLVIENKAAGLVLEATGRDATGPLALVPKAGKRRPAQCWYLARDEKGYVLTNAQSGRSLCTYPTTFVGEEPRLVGTSRLDPKKDVPDRSLFQLTESRHEVVISSLAKNANAKTTLTAAPKKQKGVTVYDVTLTPKEMPPSPEQVWKITEAR